MKTPDKMQELSDALLEINIKLETQKDNETNLERH